MYLPRLDAHHRTIFLMQALDVPNELTITNHIIVKFIESRRSSQPRTRELSQGAEVEAIENKPNNEDYHEGC